MGKLYWVPILLAFPATGLLVGWMAGASDTPVVATLLPLVFGVFGAIGLSALERRSRRAWLESCLEGVDPAACEAVRKRAGDSAEASLLVPAAWGLGVIMFCVACFGGLVSGRSSALLGYPDPRGLASFEVLSAEEQAMLYRMRWRLGAAKVPAPDATAFFHAVVGPVLTLVDPITRSAKLDQVLNNLDQLPDIGRPLASEEPPIPSPTIPG